MQKPLHNLGDEVGVKELVGLPRQSVLLQQLPEHSVAAVIFDIDDIAVIATHYLCLRKSHRHVVEQSLVGAQHRNPAVLKHNPRHNHGHNSQQHDSARDYVGVI